MLSPKEAAFELGISVETIHRWYEAGKLRSVRTAGNQRRIPIEEISRLRRGLKRRLSLIKEQAVEVVLIEYPDRLVRFGFSYLEEALSWMGVRLEVLNPPKQLEPSEELVQDLLTIVTVFAGRRDAHRAKGIRKRVQTALQEYETGEDLHRTTNGTGQQDHQTAS